MPPVGRWLGPVDLCDEDNPESLRHLCLDHQAVVALIIVSQMPSRRMAERGLKRPLDDTRRVLCGLIIIPPVMVYDKPWATCARAGYVRTVPSLHSWCEELSAIRIVTVKKALLLRSIVSI